MTETLPPSTPSQEPQQHDERETFFARLNKQLTMRPRWHFVVKNIAIATGISVIASLAIFAIGNAMFLWRSRELSSVIGVGGPGPSILARHFPWEAVGMSFLGVIGLIFLLRHFSTSYRWPALLLIAVILMGATSLAALSTFTPLHGTIANRALRPGAPKVFQHVFRPDVDDQNATFGEITIVTRPTLFTMETREAQEIIVTTTSNTLLPPNFSPEVGQRIMVIGEVSNNAVTATAIGGGRMMMRPGPWDR